MKSYETRVLRDLEKGRELGEGKTLSSRQGFLWLIKIGNPGSRGVVFSTGNTYCSSPFTWCRVSGYISTLSRQQIQTTKGYTHEVIWLIFQEFVKRLNPCYFVPCAAQRNGNYWRGGEAVWPVLISGLTKRLVRAPVWWKSPQFCQLSSSKACVEHLLIVHLWGIQRRFFLFKLF